MKILLFIDHLSGFGGAQRVIVNIANKMSEKGNDVEFVLTGNTEKCVYPLNDNIRINLIQKSNVANMSRVQKIKEIRSVIKRIKPNIIISFLTMVNIITIVSTFGLQIPVIISERNDPDRCSKVEKVLSKMLYKYSECVVVQTDTIKQKIESFYKKKIVIIENPLVEHDYEKSIYDSKRRIIAVGRLNKQKNYNLLLDAFGVIVREFPDYTLDIYGSGDEYENLMNKSNNMGLAANVSFKGNMKNIISVEADYDFYVMSSDFEGMPNALAEAMSVGLPCISTDCDGGGAAALIQNQNNGLLVSKGNIDELVMAMKTYITDSTFAKKMGINAKKIKNDLSNTNIMNKWECLIESLAK